MHVNEFRPAAPVNPNPAPVTTFSLPKTTGETMGQWFHDALLHEGEAGMRGSAPKVHSAPVLQPPRVRIDVKESALARIVESVGALLRRA